MKNLKKYFVLLLFYLAYSLGSVAQMGIAGKNLAAKIPSFIISTDQCLLTGQATGKDYISFGDFSIHPTTFDEVYQWRQGTDHNSSADADAILFTKAFGASTISSTITVYADPDGAGGVNITNVSGNWANSNRYIVFWLEISGSNGDMYYKYSDDLYLNIATPASATWSARTRMTTDFGTGQSNVYIDGPGKFIVLQNGDLLKPSWCNSGIVTTYRSTNNGASWTRSGDISLDNVNPNDETSIVQLDNGTIFAAIRCNSLFAIRTSKSTDNGATWSSLVNTGIPSYGKPAIGQYKNTVFGIAREYNTIPAPFTFQRTIYYITDDLVNYRTGFIDGRGTFYVYGQPLYNPGENKLIVVYATESPNTTPLQEPTRVIRKQVILNSLSATIPVTYDIDYQCLLDFAQAAGETLPSNGDKLIHSNLVATLRAGGKWTTGDEIYIGGLNNTGLLAFSKRNWLRPWEQATITGTYTVNGWDFNGTSDKFINFRVLSQEAKFLQNAAEIGVYQFEEGQSSGPLLGTGNGTFSTRTNNTSILTRFTDDKVYFAINGPATLQNLSNTTSLALWELKRTSSTVIELWKNGSLFTQVSTSVVSTGRSTEKLTIGCERYGSADDHSFSNKGFGALYIGGLKGSWSAELLAFRASLGL